MYILQGRIDSVWCPGCGQGGEWSHRKVAKALSFGDPINAPGALWDNTIQHLTENSGSQGANWNINDFVGGDKYIGLQYRELGNYSIEYRYGWIWMNCISEDSCYVKGFASEAKTTGIAVNVKEEMSMYPNPMSNSLFLENMNGQNFSLFSLNITDLCGKKIPFVALSNSDKVELRLSGMPNGLYFVNYEKDGFRHSRKITKME